MIHEKSFGFLGGILALIDIDLLQAPLTPFGHCEIGRRIIESASVLSHHSLKFTWGFAISGELAPVSFWST